MTVARKHFNVGLFGAELIIEKPCRLTFIISDLETIRLTTTQLFSSPKKAGWGGL
jgi:hypothetical protein